MNRIDYDLWGRRATCAKGESLPHAVLRVDDVRFIRAHAEMTAKQLAAMFKCHYRTIEKVRSRESWAHVA